MKRNDILTTATNIINGDRAEDYGDARENFGRIAAMWSAYLGHDINVTDVGPMLVLLKVARLAHSQGDDSFIDIAGYAALGAEMNHRAENPARTMPDVEDDAAWGYHPKPEGA
jgi:hypothetical protein